MLNQLDDFDLTKLPELSLPCFKLLSDLSSGKLKNYKIDRYFKDTPVFESYNSLLALVYLLGKFACYESIGQGTNEIENSFKQFLISIGTQYQEQYLTGLKEAFKVTLAAIEQIQVEYAKELLKEHESQQQA